MGLFSFGSSLLKNKNSGTRFSYSLTVHNLQPWPLGNKAIAVGWQRGKERFGATSSVYPSLAPGGKETVVRFNEKFDVPATLYRSGDKPAPGAPLGTFKKKCLILAVLETDGLTQATAALGRVVIDLSEYAAADSQDIRTFQVACTKAVRAAVGGDPQLTITIRCRVKKGRRDGSATAGGSTGDDAVSNGSGDTTGSRMTANLSSFLRGRRGKAQQAAGGSGSAGSEQDLRGFDKPLREQQGAASAGAMERIEEGHDPRASGGAHAHRRTVSVTQAAAPMSPAKSLPAPPTPPPNKQSATTVSATTYSHEGDQEDDDSALRHGSSTSQGSSSAHTPGSRRPPTGGGGALLDSLLEAAAQVTNSGGGATDDTSPRPARTSALQMYGGGGGEAGLLRSLQAELVSVAALEVCVYMAVPSAARGDNPARSVHAPSRRLARTLMSMGSDDAAALGGYAVGLMGAQVRAAAGEGATLALWWTNVVHLRALLQGTPQRMGCASSLVPELQALERTIFEELLTLLWDECVLPPVVAVVAAAGAAKPTAPAARRAAQEAALKKWFEGLEAAVARCVRLGPRGHVPLLRQQLMRQCLARVDALLFHFLLTGEEAASPGVLDEYDPQGCLTLPPLQDGALPFARGVLSFGGGMSVKMTVTRLQQWANSDVLTAQVWDRGGGRDAFFPLLRGAADLLMMPKELLMDRSIRQDVSTALSMRSVIYMMTNFSADEFAPEAVSSEVLVALLEDALLGGVGAQRTHLTNLSAAYTQPADEVLLKQVASGAEPGVEYDGDSEAELEAMGHLAAPPGARGGGLGGKGSSGGGAALRFRLLHDLWASGAPRKSPRPAGF